MKKCIIDDFGYIGEYSKKIQLIKENGFDSVFLNMRENKQPIPLEKILEKVEECNRQNMNILFAHLPIDTRLNDLWKNVNSEYKKEIKSMIYKLSQRNVKVFVIHSYYKFVEVSQNIIIKNLTEISQYAIQNGCEILIENVDYFNQDKFVFENMRAITKLCYDIGHENAFYKAEEKDYLLKNFSTDIRALHLHDNNGEQDEHKIPFSDNCNVDFTKLKKINNIKSLTLTLECKMEKSDSEQRANMFLKKSKESLDKIEKIIE